MSRRTLPLILLLFVCLAALVGYLLYPSGETARPEQRGPTEMAGQEPRAEELAPAELAAAEAAEALAVDEREELDVAAGTRAKLREDPGARWIEGRLEFPTGTPKDERPVVFALSESMKLSSLYRDGGPGRHAWEGRECHGLIDWSDVDANGAFRLAVPADTSGVHLAVTGRYLYSRSSLSIGAAQSDIALTAELGAWLTGTLLPPRGTEVSLDGTEVELGPDVTGGFNAFEVEELAVSMETSCDEIGSFEFRGVPTALAHGVVARPDELAATRKLGLRPEPGEHAEFDLTLTHGAVLAGRVVDETGAPVADAEVAASFRGPVGQAIGELRESNSDESGRFVLEGVAAGKLELRASHASFRPATIKVSENEARDGASLAGLELVMEIGGSISGRVLYSDGSPAEEASVSVAPDISQLGSMGGLGAMGIDWQSRGSATTDDAGRFEVVGLADGKYMVKARKKFEEGAREGTWSVTKRDVSAGDQHLALSLVPLLDIDGIVLEEGGEPIQNFNVSATLDGTGGMFGIGADRRRQGFEDEEGRFELSGLEEGTWELVVSAAGYATSEPRSITLPATDGEPLQVTLGLASSVSGVVQDTGGRPVSGAKITLKLDLAGRMAAMGSDDAPEAYSLAEGKFVLENLDPGAVQLVASLPGYAPSEPFACDVGAGERTENVVLRLRLGGTLTGQILDDQGGPDAGRMVIVQKSPDFSAQHMLTSDAQGKFGVEHLEPGTWQVVATANFLDGEMNDIDTENTQDAMAEFLGNMKMDIVTLVDGEEVFVLLGAPPANPVTVRGHVTHAGEPVASAIVSFIPEGADGLGSMKMKYTDDRGVFEVELDEPGNYLVTAQLSSEMGMQNSVEFRESIEESPEGIDLEIEMPLGVITGRVRGPDGKPAAGCRITLTVEGGHALGSMMGGHYTETATDDEGYYELTFLRPGSYSVAAGGVPFGGLMGGEASGGRAQHNGIEIEEGQHRDGIDFQLKESARILGKVVDTAGNPVTGAAIFVRSEGGQMLERFSLLTTDASGNFTYEGVAPGKYSVFAKKDGQASAETELVRVPEGGEGTVRVVLESGAYALVTVLDEQNEEVRARIQVIDPEGRSVEGMLSMEDMMNLAQGFSTKEQRIGPLAPGKYEVTATSDDGRSYTKPITLRPGAERKVKIRLE